MCWRILCCCFAVVTFFTVYTGYIIRSLLKELRGDKHLGELFNDGGCELMAEDLIRGGANMQLWHDGVAIVSAGDFNTTLHHCAREARGVGLFAVDLKAQPKPTVRKLELEGWPDGEPPLVGQGLFFSNVSRRLYVVNHGGKEEDLEQQDAEFKLGDVVQAICCCCSWFRWHLAVIIENRGSGTYRVQWLEPVWGNMDPTKTDVVKHAREIREPKLEWTQNHSRQYHTIGCPSEPPGSAMMTEAECRTEATGLGEAADPFVLISEEEPAGCFLLFNRTRIFNAHPNGVGRRAGRQLICKTSWDTLKNEPHFAVATGQEEEGPESSVAIFELQGDSFETLRLRWHERVATDLFPYHGIVDVVEGRGPDELFVLVGFAWRSTVHMPFLSSRNRNVEGSVSRNSLLASRWLRGLGLRSWARTAIWYIRNFRKLMGHHDFWDSPAGGDLGVIRCARRPDAGEGKPVRAGLRWECRWTRARGLAMARALTVSPDKTQLLVSMTGYVWRYHIDDDGGLTEVGQPMDMSHHGLIMGMHWEQEDSGSILYSMLPPNLMIGTHNERSRQRPGLPADLLVGAKPGPPGWFDSLLAYAPTLVLRHDGSLQGGWVSSWLRYKGAVLAGSNYDEGLLYCRQTQPLPVQEFHLGDRVWALWDDARDWRIATVDRNGTGSVRVVWDGPGGPTGPKGMQASSRTPQKLRSIPAARKATGPPRPGDRVLALRPNSPSWEQATVEQDHGDGNYTVTWDEQVVPLDKIKKPALRVHFRTSGTSFGWTVDLGSPFQEVRPGVAFGWTPESSSCGPEGSGTCAAEGVTQPQTQELRTWELRLAEGLYEVAVAFRETANQTGAAERSNCTLEGLELNVTGSVMVRVLDGFLTLSGCRGLVESISVAEGVEELLNAVPFFHAHIGRNFTVGHFETHTVSEVEIRGPPAGPLFLRRLPASLHPENTTILATVRGGSCGMRTVVSFQPDNATLQYFQTGRQSSWRPLERVRVLAGYAHALPSWIFTGQFQNTGWILGLPSPTGTFASSYWFSSDFELCNGQPLSGGELVTLSYVVGEPFPVRKAPALQVGELVLAQRAGLNSSQVWHPAVLDSHRDDNTAVLNWIGSEAKHRVLPLSRLLRSQETGYQRLRMGSPALQCNGYASSTHTVAREEQCMRFCDARPLCRFVAYFPVVGQCRTSTSCGAYEPADGSWGGSSSVFQKLAPLPGGNSGTAEVL